MALHELVTNAAKYGALSKASGSVSLIWTLHGGEAGRRFTIMRTEDKGLPVAAPERTRFGSMVIRRTIASALRGDVQFEFTSTGSNWRLECQKTIVGWDGVLNTYHACQITLIVIYVFQ